jgi:hypothetical protein
MNWMDISLHHFLMLNILVHKDALDKDLKKKLGIN